MILRLLVSSLITVTMAKAFTTLLQTAEKCNMKLNYDKLQHKEDEVKFFDESYTKVDAS